MKKIDIVFLGLLAIQILPGCGSSSGGAVVAGKASFVQGGSATARESSAYRSGYRLTAGDNYMISPNKAKITFKSVVFKDSSGSTLATETFDNCIVTYDRSKTSGSSLLDCPVNVPVGSIASM